MLSAIFKTIAIDSVNRYFELNTFNGSRALYVDGSPVGDLYFDGLIWTINEKLYNPYVEQLVSEFDACAAIFDWNLHEYLNSNIDWAAFDITDRKLILALKGEISLDEFERALRVWLESESMRPEYKIELISLSRKESKFYAD